MAAKQALRATWTEPPRIGKIEQITVTQIVCFIRADSPQMAQIGQIGRMSGRQAFRASCADPPEIEQEELPISL